MLVKLLKKGPMLARYFIYGLAIQLLLFQEVVAFGVNEKDKSDALQTKPAGDLVAAILVEGKVVDGEGNPIPGAAILVKGTTSGTTTDIDGNFSLEVDEEAIIVVSFLGFITQEIEVGNQTDFEITLVEDIAQMDEVVVVGFGTQKKSHLTAAVEQIGSDLIENRPINRLSEALQGAVAGLYVTPVNGGPAQESNFNIRGYTGFGQKGGPLVLIDGIERTMSDVNPNDVESVTVLKDAAASAIYGSRAPSGVILITTKSGTKGEKIQVNYSGNYSIGSPIGMPQWANSWEYAEKINEQYRNSLQAPIYTEEAIQRMRDHGAGLIPNNIVTENGTYGAHWDMNGNSDWFDIMYKSVVPSQQHNASVSGGSNNTGYYVGLGYNESMGLIKGSDDRLNRYNALLKVNSDVTDWLSLRMSMNYVRTDEQAPNYRGGGPNYGDIWQNASASLPNWNDLNPNGSPSFLSSGPSLRGEGGTQTNQRNETTLTGGFTLKPFEGLDIRGNYTWRNLTSHLERNTFVIFVEEADGSIRNSARSAQQSSVIRQMNFTNYHTADIVADYNKQIGKHSINALVGYQEEYNNFSRLSGTGRDLYTNSVPSISTTFNPNPTVNDMLTHWATQGVFGRMAYNYAEKYFIEFNGRYDAHSKFPAAIRWSFFPSISGAWNIAEENFWSVNKVDAFKIRAAYTSSGDPGSGNYLYLPTMGTGIGNGDVLLGGVKPNMVFMPPLVSSDLTWSSPQTLGFGLDVVAIENRLELTYDWYQRTIYNQPGPAKILPQTIGTGLPSINNAVSETRGWEFSMKWRNTGRLAGRPINYSARFNIADYIGYVVEYDENVNGQRNGTWTPGQVFGQIWMYESNGVAQDIADVEANVPQGGGWYYPGDLMMKDLNGDGQINAGEGGRWYARGDQVMAGYNYGRYRYGMNLQANWNGIDLSVTFTGVPKWITYTNNFHVIPAGVNIWNSKWFTSHRELGTWSPETPDNYFPRHSFKTYGANDQYVENLAHLRVQNLRLGYNLPQSLLERAKLRKVYVYTSAENLGMIYYKSNFRYEPEILSRYGGNGYPPQRQISFGVNVGI
ncbi:SusC/RagA family TonB-linked outer membrane protein [Cyclobacterium sp. SYSU L10401]|uniref:SusC/RagA family TonB-linked outer membrane protein n=1 Tax=Cyclobacterium sp. SYSU L10401 TaxID=2678657 RepID=UPI0013D146C9|nr:TonB-dependent receptor [Cyclobacterium sp. SYSU L10401]